MVFGGMGVASDHDKDTEKCTVAGSKIECSIQEPNLTRCATYPELFLVEPDFCDTTKQV